MTQTPCVISFTQVQQFLPARLEVARRCPARSDYIDLRFETSNGSWDWCFPAPTSEAETPDGPLALTMGPGGVQIHLLHDDGLGPRLQNPTALAMILAGAEVSIARRLVRS
jgi:hypothetical protein